MTFNILYDCRIPAATKNFKEHNYLLFFQENKYLQLIKYTY